LRQFWQRRDESFACHVTLLSVDVPLTAKHHLLVRLAHWLNIPLLLGLTLSGISVYWASPVFKPFPPWVYERFSLGTFDLARALRLHWFFAYWFMLNGLIYAIGLVAGGGWRDLLPRRHDLRDAWAMIRFYAGFVPMKLRRKPWPHPVVTSKYNALQRAGYLSMPLAGLASIASGWAMHKPVQLGWLERLFLSYDGARVVHFFLMWVFLFFVVPHVVLVVADGWDTFRSMVTGWSERTHG